MPKAMCGRCAGLRGSFRSKGCCDGRGTGTALERAREVERQGLLPVPQTYRRPDSEPMPDVSGDLATELSAHWRQQFTQEASRRGLDPIETFQGAARQAPAAQRKSLRAVLAGHLFNEHRIGPHP